MWVFVSRNVATDTSNFWFYYNGYARSIPVIYSGKLGEHIWEVLLGTAYFGSDWMGLFPALGYMFLGGFIGETVYKNRTSIFKKYNEKLNKNTLAIVVPGRYSLWFYLLHQVIYIIIIGGLALLMGAQIAFQNMNKEELGCKKEQSIYETILSSTNRWPRNTAIIYMGHKFKYEHLLKRINQFARSLKDLGCKKDEIITVCLPNIPDAVYLLYAINQIGCIANIVHPSYNLSQMEENIDKTKSKLLFCLDLSYQMFKPLEDKGVRVFSCSPTNELTFVESMVYHHQNKKKIGKIEFKNSSKQFYFAKRYTEYDTRYLDDAVLLNSGGTSGKGTPTKITFDTVQQAQGSHIKITDENLPRVRKQRDDQLDDVVERAAGHRYGNASKVRLEIRYGRDNSVFELVAIKVDYIKAPQHIRLTQEQIDLTEDTSQILEFPDYVCQEIINELVKIIMENASDPRVQTQPLVSQSIASPAQEQTQTSKK